MDANETISMPRPTTGKVCPFCGKGSMALATTRVSRTFAGRTYEMDVPSVRCPDCGEGMTASKALGRFEAAVARTMVASGAVDGAAVKWLRKVAGFTGVELAELFGVTAKTVSRWETGATSIDRATLHTLGELASDGGEDKSDTADALREMANPLTRHPPPVRFLATLRS